MTRLTQDNIASIPTSWTRYTARLKERTGLSLFALACHALDIDVQKAQRLCQGQHLAIIPLSSGEGSISGFDTALESIASYLGFATTILPADEAGFARYRTEHFDLAIWADDHRFVVENKESKQEAENGVATGLGFAEALHALLVKNRSSQKEPILVRGCGPVGSRAALHLLRRGYTVLVCDTITTKAQALLRECARKGYEALAFTPASLCEYTQYIHAVLDAAPNTHAVLDAAPNTHAMLDAAPNTHAMLDAALSPAQHDHLPINHETLVAAPCVPYLWEDTAKRWHDPLQLGTAVMLVAAATKSPCTPSTPVL